MKAIIMAGGEGSRLRPITCDCPKPMVPVMGRPVMAYALELLRGHGITDIGVTLMYLPERVRDFFEEGDSCRVRLRYYVERTPLGTAGSVKQAADFLTEPFIVLSGDGLTDCDLSAAIAQHRRTDARATMVLKRVETPLEYGVVITGGDGRVLRFVEKPGWNEVFSDAVNTGIYIFEPEVLSDIPEGPYDFGSQLFPAMVARGDKVYGYFMDGDRGRASGAYWCDIGDVSAYVNAHIDLMDGKAALAMPGGFTGKTDICRMPGSLVDPGARLVAPCFIDAGARVGRGAVVGPYAVIGAGAVVEEDVTVKRSVVMGGARLLAGSAARGCVVCRGGTLGEGAQAYEGSVVGEGAILATGGKLMPGVKVWPRKRTGQGATVDANVVWGALADVAFEGDRLPLESPQFAALAAQAYAASLKVKEVVLAQSEDGRAEALARAFTAGLVAQGVNVLDVGEGILPGLRMMQGLVSPGGGAGVFWGGAGAGGGSAVGGGGAFGGGTAGKGGGTHAVLVDSQGVTLLDCLGIPLSRAQQRRVEGALARQDFDMPFQSSTGAVTALGPMELLYTRGLCAVGGSAGVSAGNARGGIAPKGAEGVRGGAVPGDATGARGGTAAGVNADLRDGVAGGAVDGHGAVGGSRPYQLPPVAVHVLTPMLLRTVEEVMERLRIPGRVEWDEEKMELAPGELGLWIDTSGQRLSVADEAGMLSEGEHQLLRGTLAIMGGMGGAMGGVFAGGAAGVRGESDMRGTLDVPAALGRDYPTGIVGNPGTLPSAVSALVASVGATHALEALAGRHGIPIIYAKSDAASQMRAMLEGNLPPAQGQLLFEIAFDAIRAMLHLLSCMAARGVASPRGLLSGLPELHRRSRTITLSLGGPGRVLRMLALSEPEADLTDGVRVKTERGWAWIRPAADGARCMVVSESRDVEFAKELCDFYSDKVRQMGEDVRPS